MIAIIAMMVYSVVAEIPMKPFLDADFLLHGDTAKRLFHNFAAGRPIYDYHNHLSPRVLWEVKLWQEQ